MIRSGPLSFIAWNIFLLTFSSFAIADENVCADAILRPSNVVHVDFKSKPKKQNELPMVSDEQYAVDIAVIYMLNFRKNWLNPESDWELTQNKLWSIYESLSFIGDAIVAYEGLGLESFDELKELYDEINKEIKDTKFYEKALQSGMTLWPANGVIKEPISEYDLSLLQESATQIFVSLGALLSLNENAMAGYFHRMENRLQGFLKLLSVLRDKFDLAQTDLDDVVKIIAVVEKVIDSPELTAAISKMKASSLISNKQAAMHLDNEIRRARLIFRVFKAPEEKPMQLVR